MADKYLVNSADLTSVADAIRSKAGISSSISFPAEFISSITNIQTGAEIKTCTVRFVGGDNSMWWGIYAYTECVDGIISTKFTPQDEQLPGQYYDITLNNVVCGSAIYFDVDYQGDSFDVYITGSDTATFIFSLGELCGGFIAPQEANAVCTFNISGFYDGGLDN